MIRTTSLALLASALIGGLWVRPASAQTYTWNTTTGNLDVGSNWVGGIAPTRGGRGF